MKPTHNSLPLANDLAWKLAFLKILLSFSIVGASHQFPLVQYRDSSALLHDFCFFPRFRALSWRPAVLIAFQCSPLDTYGVAAFLKILSHNSSLFHFSEYLPAFFNNLKFKFPNTASSEKKL
jgi:hypothetical protein